MAAKWLVIALINTIIRGQPILILSSFYHACATTVFDISINPYTGVFFISIEIS